MSSTIWKYEISTEKQTELLIPQGGEILHLAAQGGEICMWVWVNPCLEKETRKFNVLGTGHPVLESAQEHVGTVLISPFIWHVFELFTQ